MHFEEKLIKQDDTTVTVKKVITAKVVIKSKDGYYDSNRELCVVEDTGNGYIARFPSWTSTQQDQYTCLDYAQAEHLMHAIAEFLGKNVVSKEEAPVKPIQEELVSATTPEPDEEGWVVHDGDVMPVSADTRVDVRFRTGRIDTNIEAGLMWWAHDNDNTDIMAWRYAK